MFDRLKSLLGAEPKGPPSARAVARRAAVLQMVITFGMRQASGEAQPDDGAMLRTAAKDMGLWDAFSPWERSFLSDRAAAAEKANVVQASWRIEAYGVLLWAVQRVPWLPPYDEMFSHDIGDKIPREPDASAEFIATAVLRDRAELEKQRDLVELWHWRSRTRQLIEKNEPFPAMPTAPGAPQFKSYDDIVRFTAKAAKENGTFGSIVDEDFPAHEKAYRDLTPDQWSEVTSITVERHFALNWLCGHAPGNRWDETPTDT